MRLKDKATMFYNSHDKNEEHERPDDWNVDCWTNACTTSVKRQETMNVMKEPVKDLNIACRSTTDNERALFQVGHAWKLCTRRVHPEFIRDFLAVYLGGPRSLDELVHVLADGSMIGK